MIGILVGMVPAFSSQRTDLETVTRRLGTSRRSSSLFQRGLVAADIALALAVLVGASLLLKSSFVHHSLSPGFSARNVATAQIDLPDADWPDQGLRHAFFDGVMGRVRALPGVQVASVITELPSEKEDQLWPIFAEGTGPMAVGELPWTLIQVCDGTFHEAMEIPVISGRGFDPDEQNRDALPVVIVNEAMARTYWPGQDPIGKRIAVGEVDPSEDDWYVVVGLVGDTYNRGWGLQAEPEVYFPFGQITPYNLFLVAKTKPGVSARELLPAINSEIRNVSSNVPVSRLRTMNDVISETHWELRLFSWALSVFAAVSLFMAASGVNGIAALLVGQRGREIAVRIAVGGRTGTVRRMFLSEGMRVLAMGVLLGLAITILTTRVLEGVLFRVSPVDPTVLFGSIATLSLVVFGAQLLPLRKINQRAPMSLLREGGP
jgi:putative ABC transport system permease protein